MKKTGDWKRAEAILKQGPRKLRAAIPVALRQEAHLLRKEIVQGLTHQSPGGKPIAAPSPLTLAARRLRGFAGTKALIVRADLRNSISVIVRGETAFVGVPRSARRSDGTGLINIAQVQEFGSQPTVVPMTEAQRKFLFMVLKEAGITSKEGGRAKVIVMQVPARPFLRPAFKSFQRGAEKRFLKRIEKLLGDFHA